MHVSSRQTAVFLREGKLFWYFFALRLGQHIAKDRAWVIGFHLSVKCAIHNWKENKADYGTFSWWHGTVCPIHPTMEFVMINSYNPLRRYNSANRDSKIMAKNRTIISNELMATHLSRCA